MAEKDDPKQRLTELNTGEVSIVDEPANERHWEVIKRKGAANMATITKAKFTEMQKAVDAAAADMQEKADVAEKAVDEGASDAAEKMKEAKEAMTKFRTLQKAMPPFPPDAEDKKEPPEPPADQAKKKAAEDAAKAEETAKAAEESAKKQAGDIAKMVNASLIKSLGGADVGALEQAASASLGALHAVDEARAKSVVVAVMKELPGKTTVSVPSQVKPAAVGTADEGEKGELYKSLTKRLEAAESELVEIKKSRNPSNSGGGGDNNDGSQPVKKSMWSGLFAK